MMRKHSSELEARDWTALSVRNLNVWLPHNDGERHILRDVSLLVTGGITTVVVGESGSGKSVLMRSLLGLESSQPGIVSGSILCQWTRQSPQFAPLEGLESAAVRAPGGWTVERTWRAKIAHWYQQQWGREVGYVSQNGRRALDPTRPIGATLYESIRLGEPSLTGHQLQERACKLLDQLRLQDPQRVLQMRPSELSGGMAQRVVIALLLARGAKTVVCDEPTTGLDPEAADALMELLLKLKREGMIQTLIMVSHDLEIARRMGQQVIVMAEGRIQESTPAKHFFGEIGPRSAHGQALLERFYALDRQMPGESPAQDVGLRLDVIGMRRGFVGGGIMSRQRKEVLRGVSLQLSPGEVVGIMGPSGQGKSTLAACLCGLISCKSERLRVNGHSLAELLAKPTHARAAVVQMLFQNPAAALHPRMTVLEGLLETAIQVCGMEPSAALSAVQEVLKQVSLLDVQDSYASRLSGGQLRRVGIGRILLVKPLVLLADEPTAGIDASLRAELLQLLRALTQQSQRTSILLISHDRQVIQFLSHRVFELREGRLLSVAPTESAQRSDFRR